MPTPLQLFSPAVFKVGDIVHSTPDTAPEIHPSHSVAITGAVIELKVDGGWCYSTSSIHDPRNTPWVPEHRVCPISKSIFNDAYIEPWAGLRIIIPYHHLISSSHTIIPYHHPVSSPHVILSHHHFFNSFSTTSVKSGLIFIIVHFLASTTITTHSCNSIWSSFSRLGLFFTKIISFLVLLLPRVMLPFRPLLLL